MLKKKKKAIPELLPCLFTQLLSTVQTLWPCNDLRGQRCYLQSVSQRLAQSIYWLNILLLFEVQTKDPDGKVDFLSHTILTNTTALPTQKTFFFTSSNMARQKQQNNIHRLCRSRRQVFTCFLRAAFRTKVRRRFTPFAVTSARYKMKACWCVLLGYS